MTKNTPWWKTGWFVWTWLVSAHLLMIATWWIWMYRGKNPWTDPLVEVKRAIESQEQSIGQNLQDIESYLVSNKRYTFTDLNKLCKYPTYLYLKDRVIYWSNNMYLPENPLKINNFGFVKLSQGVFMVHSRTVHAQGKEFILQSIFPLHFTFHARSEYLPSRPNPQLFDPKHRLVDIQLEQRYGYHSITFENLGQAQAFFLFDTAVHDHKLHYLLYAMLLLWAGLFVFYFPEGSVKIRLTQWGALLLLLLLEAIVCSDYLINQKSEDFFEHAWQSKWMIIHHLVGALLLLGWLGRYTRLHSHYRYGHTAPWPYLLIALGIYSVYLAGLFYTLKMAPISIDVYSIARLSDTLLVNSIYLWAGGSLYLGAQIFLWRAMYGHQHIAWIFVGTGFVSMGIGYSLSNGFGVWLGVNILLTYLGSLFVSGFDLRSLKFSDYLVATVVILNFVATTLYIQSRKDNKQYSQEALWAIERIKAQFLKYDQKYLIQLVESAAEDKLVKNMYKQPLVQRKLVEKRVQKKHLEVLAETFASEVHFYTKSGSSLQSEDLSYPDLWRKIFKNNKSYVPLGNQPKVIRKGYDHLLLICPVKDSVSKIGHLCIELTPQKWAQNGIVLPLLEGNIRVDQRHFGRYEYALLDMGKVLSRTQRVELLGDADSLALHKLHNLRRGQALGGDFYFLSDLDHARQILVAIPMRGIKYYLGIFALYFMLCMGLYSFIKLMVSVRKAFREHHTSFTTKIQIYLNIAFFVPLISTSAVLYTFSLNDHLLSQQERYSEIVQSVAESVSKQWTEPNKYLWSEWSNLAQERNLEINIFDSKGKLLYSSIPEIYSSKLLSPYMNPKAISAILEQKLPFHMEQISIGNFHYFSVYQKIIDRNNGKLLGVASIPFFQSEYVKQSLAAQLLENILLTFVAIFLVFLILIYSAARVLTIPIHLLINSLKRVSLLSKNEPLNYRSQDEIGILVQEYNAMLDSLEKSKEQLAKLEKESTWKEIARQVAHEIKNPLTPMKLHLQNLKRRILLSPDSLSPQEVIAPLDNVLYQVDILDEIASSFSALAQMPAPMLTEVDLVSVLVQATELLTGDKQANVDYALDCSQCMVQADRALLHRIVLNLLLNGIESVTSGEPHLVLRLACTREEAIVCIQDNGMGIPESMKEQVFLPNFSTKRSGSGIGLAVAYRGMHQMGGRLWFESAEGSGTRFYFALPRTSEEATA